MKNHITMARGQNHITIVLSNGRIIQFRQRDADFPRFSVYGFAQHEEYYQLFKEKQPNADLDDCDGMELGWWITILSK